MRVYKGKDRVCRYCSRSAFWSWEADRWGDLSELGWCLERGEFKEPEETCPLWRAKCYFDKVVTK